MTRALLLYNRGEAIAHLEGDLWAVRSEEHGGFYRVDLAEESCTCPDYEHRAGPLGIACKPVYLIAVAHATRRRRKAILPLRVLEERYRHELLDDEERQELRDRVLALRRRLDR